MIMDWMGAHAGVIGLVFFFTFFTLTALWVFRPGIKENYKKYAEIPLKESDE